jgi:serine phosphatase RsbU (regulator of sigma subunit)
VREGLVAPAPSARVVDGRGSQAGLLARARGIGATPVAIIALVVGLLVSAALALTTLALYNRNEDRLLKLRLRELTLVLSNTLPSIQTQLASAATLADATGGSARSFDALMAANVGQGRSYASASLWKLSSPRPARVAAVGSSLLSASRPQAVAQFLARTRPGIVELTPFLEGPRPGLGLAYSAPGRPPKFAVYVETALPANRHSKIESNSAFSDLNYVVYFGRSRSATQLLITNVGRLPLRGRRDSGIVPYGGGEFTLVVGPKGALGGAFFRDLPWIVGVFGVLLSIAAAFTALRLARGRERAHQLALDLDAIAAGDRERYREQWSISQTLQHALLPAKFPELAGLEVSALYVPASSWLEVGGDWYDVVELDASRVLLIIGDVSGHGLEAATTMALLRHAALAYAAQDARPAEVLENLARFARTRDGESCFATVLCAQISLDEREVRLSSAGHLAPLILNGERADFVDLKIDPAIGLRPVRPQYRESVEPLPSSATLIAFTDGLVERRGEVIDMGLSRLRSLASSTHEPLADLVETLARNLTFGERRDDTAIVGVRWQR